MIKSVKMSCWKMNSESNNEPYLSLFPSILSNTFYTSAATPHTEYFTTEVL